MFEPINKLAQAQDPILNNLQETENKLQELNQEVGNIVREYNEVNSVTQAQQSFFNFDNPYFLLTLAALVMLALSLWFLRHELKAKNKAKSLANEPKSFVQRTDPFKDNKNKIEEDEPRITYNQKKEAPAPDNKKIKSSGKKIKVVKVK